MAWAEAWAVDETFGIRPEDLNDDRLGRCLDDLAAIPAALRGQVTVQAMTAVGLATKALREHARCQDFVLLGDSKLRSTPNRRAQRGAGVGYLAPLARTPELDAAFLALPPGDLAPWAEVSERPRDTPPDERTSYQGVERTVAMSGPDEHGGEQTYRLRRLFVVSREARAACQRNRARQRARAEAEILGVLGRVGSRWEPPAERDGQPRVTCALIPAALQRAEALDGYSVLETTRTPAEAAATALLAEWKGQWQIEQRHRDAKGPLRIRPLFVTSNRRIVGLVTMLGLALMVFSLIERAARRGVPPGEQVPNLLAGHVAARPTGDNLFKALRDIALVTFETGGLRHQLVEDVRPLHHTLLSLLSIPETAYARLNA